MRKNHKRRLSIDAETIRRLSDRDLQRVAGGVAVSWADSGCVSCDVCPSRDPVCTQFPCITALGATCPPVCRG